MYLVFLFYSISIILKHIFAHSRKNYKDMMDGDTDTEADNTAEDSGGGGGGGSNNKTGDDLKRLGSLDDDALRALATTQRSSPNAKSSRFNFYVEFGKRQFKAFL